jgi:PAS domain S-box-containing protein
LGAVGLGQKRAIDLILDGAPLESALEVLAQTLEKHLDQGALASVLLLDDEGAQLYLAAAPSLPKAYNEAIEGLLISPCSGSCGTAAYHGKTVIVSDIASDPLWRDYREVALAHGLRACWSTPIFSSLGKVLGTFALYYPDSRDPSPNDREVVDLITHTAAILIERQTESHRRYRAEEALHESEEHFRALVEVAAQMLFIANADGNVTYFNQRFYDYTGTSLEKAGKWSWSKEIHPEDAAATLEGWTAAVQTKTPYEAHYRLRRADGEYRWHLERAVPVQDLNGKTTQWYGSLTDVHEQKTMAELLQKLKAGENPGSPIPQ